MGYVQRGTIGCCLVHEIGRTALDLLSAGGLYGWQISDAKWSTSAALLGETDRPEG